MCWFYYGGPGEIKWDLRKCLNIPEHLRIVREDRKRYAESQQLHFKYGPEERAQH